MIREDRFLISRKQFAVDLSTLTTDNDHTAYLTAAWYRRRRGVTVACIGHLWDIQNPLPKDAAEFLQRHTDGRHGGTCHGRWDGESYWGTGTLTDQEQHLAILRPMLANYPAIPPGHDGWWRF
jgi:hypothetical protein